MSKEPTWVMQMPWSELTEIMHDLVWTKTSDSFLNDLIELEEPWICFLRSPQRTWEVHGYGTKEEMTQGLQEYLVESDKQLYAIYHKGKKVKYTTRIVTNIELT